MKDFVHPKTCFIIYILPQEYFLMNEQMKHIHSVVNLDNLVPRVDLFVSPLPRAASGLFFSVNPVLNYPGVSEYGTGA